MKNVDMKVESGKLIITVDLAKEFGQSKSGKTTIVASTEGNQRIQQVPGMMLGLNIYKYPQDK